MKKKNLKKLSLNKDAISSFAENAKGGVMHHGPIPPTVVSRTPTYCGTQNNECASSVVAWCNLSCWVC